MSRITCRTLSPTTAPGSDAALRGRVQFVEWHRSEDGVEAAHPEGLCDTNQCSELHLLACLGFDAFNHRAPDPATGVSRELAICPAPGHACGADVVADMSHYARTRVIGGPGRRRLRLGAGSTWHFTRVSCWSSVHQAPDK